MSCQTGLLMKIIHISAALALVPGMLSCSGMKVKYESGGSSESSGMTMHHQHIMLNHALGMALDGSSLVMLGQMDMVPGVDEISIDHGRTMMKNARDEWDRIMSGQAMMKMHDAGKTPAVNPLMKYTHQLAMAQMKVMSFFAAHATMKGHTMIVHHQHIMLNHALKMALEGSNLIMTGQMGMSPGLDNEAIEHGKVMIEEALELWNEIMSGESMERIHGEGYTLEKDAGMKFTHQLAEKQLKVIDLLTIMPAATE